MEVKEVTLQCKHKYVFLRQETRNTTGNLRYPTYQTKDVYFCEKCLEYEYKVIDACYRESDQFTRIIDERDKRW